EEHVSEQKPQHGDVSVEKASGRTSSPLSPVGRGEKKNGFSPKQVSWRQATRLSVPPSTKRAACRPGRVRPADKNQVLEKGFKVAHHGLAAVLFLDAPAGGGAEAGGQGAVFQEPANGLRQPDRIFRGHQ